MAELSSFFVFAFTVIIVLIIIASNLLFSFCPFFCQRFMDKIRRKGKRRRPRKSKGNCFRRGGGGVKGGGRGGGSGNRGGNNYGKSGLYYLLILFCFSQIISFVNSLIEDEAAGRGGSSATGEGSIFFPLLLSCNL